MQWKEFITNTSEATTGQFNGEQVGKTKDMNWKRKFDLWASSALPRHDLVELRS
jgi:hypothetical protein